MQSNVYQLTIVYLYIFRHHTKYFPVVTLKKSKWSPNPFCWMQVKHRSNSPRIHCKTFACKGSNRQNNWFSQNSSYFKLSPHSLCHMKRASRTDRPIDTRRWKQSHKLPGSFTLPYVRSFSSIYGQRKRCTMNFVASSESYDR